jgi:hypothetical protein
MRKIHLSMAFCAFLITLTCYAKGPVMSDTNTYCIGRFLVDVPKDAQINGQAYQYLYGRIDSEHSAAAQDELATDVTKKESALKRVKADQGYSLDSTVSAGADSKIVISKSEPFGRVHYAFDAFRADANTVFSMQASPFNDAIFKNEVLPTLKTQLLPNLRARAAGEIPSRPGFCLKDGFIANSGSAAQFEDAGISFKFAQWPGVLVSVRTMTITKTGEPSLLKRMDSGGVPDAFKNLASRIQILRRGGREINGRSGEEMLSTVPAEGGFHLHQFRWEAQGTSVDDPLKPTLIVELQSGMTLSNGEPVRPKLTDDQAIALFDAVANSLRIRPVGDVKTGDADPSPTLPLGALAQTGSICPQKGWWTCPEASSHELEGGARQHFAAGTILPTATVLGTPTIADRIRGIQPRHVINTTWRLVDYDADQIDSKGTTDS